MRRSRGETCVELESGEGGYSKNIVIIKKKKSQGIMAHACNGRFRRQRQEDYEYTLTFRHRVSWWAV